MKSEMRLGALRSGTGRWWRALLIVGTLAAFLSISVARNARAQCSGTSCLPTTGYTWDREWNCGAFYSVQACWFPGYRPPGSHHGHTWGWASARHTASASVRVRLDLLWQSQGPAVVSAEGWDLARLCYYTRCGDQDSQLLHVRVGHHNQSSPKTVLGHGKG